MSSPKATGGAGVFFEQHVLAYWLAQLLVGSIPPIFIDTIVTEVHFQTEHLGWNTDDFLIVCENQAGKRRLAGQVKRNFTVSAGNQDCAKAIGDYWKDFVGANPFDAVNDRFVLVTLRGTNTLLEHFVGLLECARSCSDGNEFERRLSLNGFLSSKASAYYKEVHTIVEAVEGTTVATDKFWEFLSLINVVSLDLHSQTRQTEAQVKNLLALTAAGAAPLVAAEGTWSALLDLASTGMTHAASYLRKNMPAELLSIHRAVAEDEHRVLKALKAHASPIFRRIRSTIGADFKLPRTGLVREVLDALQTSQVVMIAGSSGSGKSVVAKDVIAFLAKDYFTFGFRAEEFAQPHIDATLQASQIPSNISDLEAILSSQDRKIVAVESVERLLEKSTRDAFSDLLTTASGDHSLKLLLTCRDYSVEQVRASFLIPLGIVHALIRIPLLGDAELAEIEGAIPSLASPLRSAPLRKVLRTPYVLDKALQLGWTAESSLPVNEREFRRQFWKKIVCAHEQFSDGTPRRRDMALKTIGVNRARALTEYAPIGDLPPDLVAALKSDSLVISPDDSPVLLAPAHDVLEDWALLEWIDEQNVVSSGSFHSLAGAVGTHPALRRSYRRWVAEVVDQEPNAADGLFLSALTQETVAATFRDDTLIALLKSPSASAFLHSHRSQLLLNGSAKLLRLVHLLRVGCMRSLDWIGPGSVTNVPVGDAWASVLELVAQNIQSLGNNESLLLSLIEDSVRGVTWETPEVDAAESISAIAHWLLSRGPKYGITRETTRILKVVAKIPNADAGRFEAVLSGAGVNRGTKSEFMQLLFAGFDGMQFARDLPEVAVSFGREILIAEKTEREWSSTREMSQAFGVATIDNQFFPPSSLRGPWLHLLRYHPRTGLKFILEVFNHSVTCYARGEHRLEPAKQVELVFSSGMKRRQWSNGSLWNLFRGTSVGPNALQSLLMALEAYLLEYVTKYPEDTDSVLLDLLANSESASIAAVVASVATANVRLAGETLLVLLSVRDYIRLDRRRWSKDLAGGDPASRFPGVNVEGQICNGERRNSNKLPHRQFDLEAAVTTLQRGALKAKVEVLLDSHLAALPPVAERTEADQLWHIALHRMDLRRHQICEETNEGISGGGLIAGPPPEEVRALVEESISSHLELNLRLDLYHWGLQVFEHRASTMETSSWREQLARVKNLEADLDDTDTSRNAPGFIAAVCVRDHWEEMESIDQDWCLSVVSAEVARQADDWERDAWDERFSMSADRPCALAISTLLSKPLSDDQRAKFKETYATAHTHPINEVRRYAIAGLNRESWAADRSIVLRTVNLVAHEAAMVDETWRGNEGKPYQDRLPIGVIVASVAAAIRKLFWTLDVDPSAYLLLDITDGYGADAAAKLLTIVGQISEDPIGIPLFERSTRALVGWWDEDYTSNNDRSDFAETALSSRLYQFAMQAEPKTVETVLAPVFECVDRHPQEVSAFVQGLTNIEAASPKPDQFWCLWSFFAERVKKAKWIEGFSEGETFGRDLLLSIFLAEHWDDGVVHWKSLDGQAHRIDSLFTDLPPSWVAVDCYLRFLHSIGRQSLPQGFVTLAQKLKEAADARELFREGNTVFLLEVVLQSQVYARPAELKRDPTVRASVLALLDILVECGSSAAFKMRDDFVTPAG